MRRVQPVDSALVYYLALDGVLDHGALGTSQIL